MPSSAEPSDVLVVGGGIMGLMTALNLADRGRSVTVLEQDRVWAQASGVNAGSLGVQNKLPPLVPYTVAALEIWKGLSQRLRCDIDFHQTGGYKVATTDDEVRRLQAGAQAQQDVGLPVRWMEKQDIREETPWLSDEVLAATYCAYDSFASPIRVGPAIHQSLLDAGVDVVENLRISDIEIDRGVKIATDRGSFRGDIVVVAAGAWSGRVAALFGAELPISLDVNMVSVTEPAPRVIGRIVTHARGILTLKQVSNGSCLIGGGWQGIGSLDDCRKDIEFDQIIHNLRLARKVIPGLGPLNILRSWAGYEGVSPDSLPFIGRLPGFTNAYVAACARGGFTLGPVLTKLLCELIVDGKPSMTLDSFDPGRFRQ